MYVLTGAPGTGKTAILDALGPGVVTVPEPAREILAEQRAGDGAALPDRDPAAFVAALLERSIAKHEDHLDQLKVIFDRGIPDCAAYAAGWNLDTTSIDEAAHRHRYSVPVLIAPPWEAIFTNDDERTMPFAWVEPFHDNVVAAYERAGYPLIEVPRVPLEERVAFVRQVILGGRASN